MRSMPSQTTFPCHSSRVTVGGWQDTPGLCFNRNGGRVSPGFLLTMSRPAGTSGTIYFTLDGTDPRVFGSGSVSGSATAYSGGIEIENHTHAVGPACRAASHLTAGPPAGGGAFDSAARPWQSAGVRPRVH